MPRGNQLARQWRLLQLVGRPTGVEVGRAAAALGCAVRTVWRDLRVLQDAGFPIYDDRSPDGRRSVWRTTDRPPPPLKLSLDELAGLVMVRDLLEPAGSAVLGDGVDSAFRKIASLLGKDAVALLDRMRETIGVRAVGAKLQAPAAQHLRAIRTGLTARRQLQLRYYSASRDETTDRRVDPYRLAVVSGCVYLVAYCHLREAPRIFAVERMRQVTVLPSRFAPATNFDVERYLEGAWGILRGEITQVRVIFDPDVARYVRERRWHSTQRFRTRSDGRLEMIVRVADTLEVRQWIQGFGASAEVLEPASLRAAICREAARLLEKVSGAQGHQQDGDRAAPDRLSPAPPAYPDGDARP